MSYQTHEHYMILGIGTCDPLGGQKTVTDGYIEAFRGLGVKIHWLIFGLNPPAENTREITYLRLRENWQFYFSKEFIDEDLRTQVLNINKSLNPSLIFRPLEFAYEPYLEGLTARTVAMILLLNRPLIQSAKQQEYFRSPLVTSGVLADEKRLAIEQITYQRADQLISNSLTTFNDLQNHYPEFAAKHSICSPPGARREFFDVPPLKINQEVLYFGRLTHQKGISHLIRRVPSPWRLNILGRGKWPTEQFSQLGINFEGWQEIKNICHSLQTATFCLFPSHYEPWGLSLNEALAAGRICIAQSGAGGHEEQIRDEENGFLFDFAKNSFWDFLDELLLRDPQSLLKVSQQARQGARTWEQHIEEIADHLQRSI